MAGLLVGLGDGGGGQAQGGDAGAGTGPHRQVAGHGEGLRRQGRKSHPVAPAGEDTPLGAVDAAGVVGEDGFQRVSHALVGGAQGRRRRRLAKDNQRVGGGVHGRVSGGGVSGAIQGTKDAR